MSPTATEFPAHGTTAGAGEANGGSGAGSAWTPGRTASVIAGGVLAFFASGLVIGGAATLWADRANRDSAGYLTSASTTFSTPGRALASESMNVNAGGPDWAYPRSVLGDVRFRFTADDPSRETFVAVAPTSAVRGYLAGMEYATVTDFGSAGATYTVHAGGAPATPPAAAAFWAAKASGSGPQTLTWTPSRGDWTILVMNTDGSPGLSVRADAGANVPALTWVAICLRRRPDPAGSKHGADRRSGRPRRLDQTTRRPRGIRLAAEILTGNITSDPHPLIDYAERVGNRTVLNASASPGVRVSRTMLADTRNRPSRWPDRLSILPAAEQVDSRADHRLGKLPPRPRWEFDHDI